MIPTFLSAKVLLLSWIICSWDCMKVSALRLPFSPAGFPIQHQTSIRTGTSRRQIASSSLSSSFIQDDTTVRELLQSIKSEKENNDNNNDGSLERINVLVKDLEDSFTMEGSSSSSSSSRFEPLIGLYTVAKVLSKKRGENPVGGKWTRPNSLTRKLFRSRTSFQHILPPTATTAATTNTTTAVVVAQAINVISFEALCGVVRCTVMLRGDCTPLTRTEQTDLSLSCLAVRAHFDPPRIVFGRRGRVFNIQLGPRSSVILDATYNDGTVRIGKGGTSGTRFVFQRIKVDKSDADADDALIKEANEFRALLARPPMRRSKQWSLLMTTLTLGMYQLIQRRNIVSGTVISLCSLCGCLILQRSTGGIEEDSDD